MNTTYGSNNVVDSEYVVHSNNVEDSTYIFDSEDVKSSHNVTNAFIVEHSKNIYGSEFIYDSFRVVSSKNATGSQDVVFSDCAVNSHNISCARNVKWSGYVSDMIIGRTKDLDHCYFVSNSERLNHCMFCVGLIGAEYCLFNKHFTPEEYDIYVKQLNSILKGWRPELVLHDYWPTETIPLDYPVIQRNICKQYINLPDKFWRWVKTLPGYDADIMYSIVFNPKAF